MDAIARIPLIGGFVSSVLPFVVVLGIVVFVHEYGHYIVARWCGIRSEVFSIGFGPVLWSRRDRRGTLWQVAALPLGGYVKYLGDADGASRTDPGGAGAACAPRTARHSFHGAAVWRRMLAVLAGPFFNFLLTIVVFAGLAMWQGVPTERPTDRLDRAAAVGRAAAPARRRDARGQRRAGGGLRGRLQRRARHAGRRARCRCASSATARRSRSTAPYRAAAAGAGGRAAVAGQRRRPPAGRPDPAGRRPRRSASFEALRADGARLGRPHDPADGLARRHHA